MSTKEIIHKISALEKSFPVNSLAYNHIKVWPIIRLIIVWALYTEDNQIKRLGKPTFRSLLVDLWYYLKYYAVTKKEKKALKKIDKQGEENNLETAELVFLTKSSERTEKIDGKYFSKFADSLKVLTKDLASVKILEYKGAEEYRYPRANPSFVITDVVSLSKVKQGLYKLSSYFLRRRRKIFNFDTFLAELKRLEIPLYYDENLLIHSIEHILFISYELEKIFKKIKANVVFVTCYYHKINMAAALACDRMGIRCVELQHGQQGDFHIMYTHWNSVPDEGYELIPSHFWMWGELSATRIKEWTTHTLKHEVIVGGNPWQTFLINQERSLNIENLGYDQSKYKISVLICLQPIDNPLPECIIHAMQRSSGILWLVRLHPRMRDRMHEIAEILRNERCSDYEIENATLRPLNHLLTSVQVNITLWSTVAYEALLYQVPTIFIHKNGNDSMSEYIRNGIFKYSENTDEILDMIVNYKSSFTKESEIKYIETSISLLKQQISNLLSKQI